MTSDTWLRGITLVTLVLAGCARNEEPAGGVSASGNPVPAGSQYVLAAEPPGALGVVEARDATQNEDDVVLVGRVGGDSDPFVKGAAAFTVVDLSLKPCPPDEGCPTPWDYCCDFDKLASHKVMVRVVDRQGRLVPVDARDLLGVEPLTTVVVRGKAKRDEAGNLTVLADGVFLRDDG